MASLVRVGLGNAAAAAILALAVAVVCRFLRGKRPAIAHALWLLVLLKLLTPPLWAVPVHLPRVAQEPAPAAPVDPTPSPSVAAASVVVHSPAPPDQDVGAGDWEADDAPELLAAAEGSQPPASAVAHPSWRDRLVTAAGVGWIAGSLACLALVVIRSCRFLRVLRHATAAPPALRRRTAELSARLGISRAPEAWLVAGAVCPMLWAVVGRPRLLLPVGLWADLDDAQRDTLIAHELAHLRRRDHWVRLTEVAATVLYWWHPAVWWARRELREAEEQCCDAWVVWSMPRCARPYMNAILKAVDFVSDAACAMAPGAARVAVPPVASGMASGEFRHLERRLSMIRQNENACVAPVRRALGRPGLIAVCAGAAGLLPLAPSLAQQEASSPRTVTVVAAPRAETATSSEVQSVVVPDGATVKVETPLRTFVVQASPEAPAGVIGVAPAATNQVGVGAAQPGAEQERARFDLVRARHDVERLSQELEAAKARLAVAEAVAGRRVDPFSGDPAPEQPQTSSAAIVGRRTAAAPPAPRGPAQDEQRRLDELERKFDRLMDEVQSLKQERQGHGQSHTPAVSLAR